MTPDGLVVEPGVDESLNGHYAGAATRFAAFIVDAVLSIGAFEIGALGAVWVVNLFTRVNIPPPNDSVWWFVPLAGWLFLYFWYCYSLAGKTPGKALLGLRVVASDGGDVRTGRAALRVLAFGGSWIFPPIGFGGIVLGARHRALHDVVAGTVVVYDYDARAAQLRFLARHPRAARTTAGDPRTDRAPFTTVG